MSTVRRATGDDLDAVVELRAVMFEAMGVDIEQSDWRVPALEWLRRHVDDPECGIFVVDDGSRVVASAMGQVRDAMPSPPMPGGRDILINNVCTLPDARGHGYGRAAFEAVLDWARGTGVHRLELLATDAGRPMYERSGFTPTTWPCMRATI